MDDLKTQMISMRLTERERAKLSDLAWKNKQTLSQYLIESALLREKEIEIKFRQGLQ